MLVSSALTNGVTEAEWGRYFPDSHGSQALTASLWP